MFPHFNHQKTLQNPIFDALLCQEECFDDDFDSGLSLKQPEINKNPIFTEHDAFWENDELVSLLFKEKNQSFCFSYDEIRSLKSLRNDGIKWMLKVVSHYGFSAMTAVLAVNYYDRFVTSSCFQKDKIWMSQLATVACLSLAAKMEETHVPLLLDFQVEECKYVFEAKIIQRMEILVLSTLGWKMNPVTPIAFFDHFVRRFDLLSDLHCEFIGRCESVILSIINDCRLVGYLPSVIAAATMVYVITEIKPCDALEYHNHLMNLLEIGKEKIDGCHRLIKEVLNDYCRKICHKRKYEVIPSSPSGVIDAYFSSESSNDSWANSPVVSSVSSSAEPLFKRTRSSDPL